MNVLHVVTLASNDGAFGGPLSVARTQREGLERLGHRVTIVAGRRAGDDARPGTFPVRQVVPGAGFSGLVSPAMLLWLWRHAREYDLAHVHLGRDLVTLLAALVLLAQGVPYVTQTHGMVTPDRRARARALDLLLTRRVLRRASRRYVLTAGEARALAGVLPGTSTSALPNGIALSDVRHVDPADPEVLFCARLHARKRPRAFVEMARLLRARGVAARFVVVGPDEGELAAMRAASDVVTYEGALPYDQVVPRLARSTVFVLPSVDEPFPMTVLEAMSAGVPTVCTSSCGIADLLRETGGAVVSEADAEALADAVGALLANPADRAALSTRARSAVRDVFAADAVAGRLERDYLTLLGRA